MEVLLGRVEGFQSREPFSNDETVQPGGEIGNGTVFMGFVGLEVEGREGGGEGGVPVGTGGVGKMKEGLGLGGWGLVVGLGVVMVM